MGIIDIRGLVHSYGEGKGLFDLDITIQKGEIFGLLGPNGAGKTTLIRHLMGFIRPQAGTCQILSMDCWQDQEEIQKHLGYIPGEIHFLEDLSGVKYLHFLKKYRKEYNVDRMEELIDRFEFDPNGSIRKMSKGMKQKLAIIQAFWHDPEILILDEPTSGLDPLMQKRFIELLKEEKERGKTIVLSSHIFEEVEKTCDIVCILYKGKKMTLEPVDILRKRHVHSYQVRLQDEEEAKRFAYDFHGIQKGCYVEVSTHQNLEEIFLSYYGERS